MKLEPCIVSLSPPPPPPPTLGAMLATLGLLTEFRAIFNGNQGSVTLMFGDKRRKRTRGTKPCAPGAVKGGQNPSSTACGSPVFCAAPSPARSFQGSPGGPKPVAKSPGAVLSGNRNPTSPARTTENGPRSKLAPFMSPPRPISTGRSTLHPTAPVERPATAEVPVEQVAQKRKASSPLSPRTVTRPTSPPSPTRWEIARCRIKGRFKDYITPPFDNIADLPHKPASDRWQILPEEMGKINIGLEDRSRSVLVITIFHGERYQQVVIDKITQHLTAC